MNHFTTKQLWNWQKRINTTPNKSGIGKTDYDSRQTVLGTTVMS